MSVVMNMQVLVSLVLYSFWGSTVVAGVFHFVVRFLGMGRSYGTQLGGLTITPIFVSQPSGPSFLFLSLHLCRLTTDILPPHRPPTLWPYLNIRDSLVHGLPTSNETVSIEFLSRTYVLHQPHPTFRPQQCCQHQSSGALTIELNLFPSQCV